ncbi:MAG: NAD(P) transhydrogenase subunit alpha [Deltaproteobacteria bacterium]|nr:NAD(P) transhydrogenase subunit alpha [Deltaproteobacteria bacterium]
MATIGVLEEAPPERRVALVPNLAELSGHTLLVQRGAGTKAGFPDESYSTCGARLASREEVLEESDLIACVRPPLDADRIPQNRALVGLLDPMTSRSRVLQLNERRITLVALELMPRISRAQSMDVLSSMATIAGYKAVVLAASMLPRLFPLLMTAAGTLSPARVLVIGAGVAGLSALATAHRLGAVTEAYDVREAAAEQVRSVGARFLKLDVAVSAEGEGGYARAVADDVAARQRALLEGPVSRSDVLIATASVPGKRAPVLISAPAIARMKPGSVVVDLAASSGGNTEVSKLDEPVTCGGATVLAPSDLAATVPFHASQLFAKNVATLIKHLGPDLRFDPNDRISSGVLVAIRGEVRHPDVLAAWRD